MTLAEYTNQADPGKRPVASVILGEKDYRRVSPWVGVTGYKTAEIAIPILEKYNLGEEPYVIRQDDRQVWSNDGHGNPKYRTVFALEKKF